MAVKGSASPVSYTMHDFAEKQSLHERLDEQYQKNIMIKFSWFYSSYVYIYFLF